MREESFSLKSKIVSGIVAAFFLCCLIVGVSSCSKVEPGYVGILVNQYGKQRGVQDYPIRTGTVMVNPFTETLYKYPTFQQTVSWVKDEHEGKPVNEEISFNSKEGTQVYADVAISYAFIAEQVPEIFVEFKQDAETLTHSYIKYQVRDAFNRAGTQYSLIGIFGEDKAKMEDAAKVYLKEVLEKKGIRIDMVALQGSPRVAESVHAAIDNVIKSSQDAIAARNRVVQANAEADQARAAAKAQADNIETLANAQAAANERLAKSLSPAIIQYQAMQRWNGVLPQVSGGSSTPFINIK